MASREEILSMVSRSDEAMRLKKELGVRVLEEWRLEALYIASLMEEKVAQLEQA